MGTRGLTKVIKNGETVVAQYGQWDHYPSGQGVTAFYAVQRPDVIERLSAKVDTLCYYPSQEEREEMWKPYMGGASQEGWVTFEEGKSFGDKYPSMTRDTGAEILYVIADSEERVPLFLDIDFEQDELFCEGVYTVNLDNQTFTSKWDEEVTLTFDEVREMSVKDYLAHFMDEASAEESAKQVLAHH